MGSAPLIFGHDTVFVRIRLFEKLGCVMSALPPKADIAECDRDVRFVPKAFCAAVKNVVIRLPRRRER